MGLSNHRLEDDFPLCWENFPGNSILSASCRPEKTMPLYFLLCYFFLSFFFYSWLLILSFPALYALPASAIKGLHGGGWDVPGRGDQGDQPDQGPQAAPHAPVPRVDGSYSTILSSCTPKSGPGTRTKHELLMSIYSCFFKNWKSHCCLRPRNMLP